MSFTESLKVLFLASEVIPFAKTGGLADVAGSLPAALKKTGVDVRVAMPYYRTVKQKNYRVQPVRSKLDIPLGRTSLTAQVMRVTTRQKVPVYLVDREDLYDRPNLYGNPEGDYYDNLERFSFFSHAALRLSKKISFTPDLVHCHDWQTGLVPALLKGPYQNYFSKKGTATLFTIHNIGYPGIFPAEKLPVTGLPVEDFFQPEGLEYWGNVSLLKSGIVYADAVTTVSPTYAQEIQSPEYGMGMEGILQKRKTHLHGILNGVNDRFWDPSRDKHLSKGYSPEDLSGKAHCKRSLIKEMNLDPSLLDKPLLGVISRLDAQKGLDLLVQILQEILDLEAGILVLGQGDEVIQQTLMEAARAHPGRMGVKIGFSDSLAHRIMAGTDMLLIPSRYEPCGLTQMYAMKYGTVPVVRATGGLDDTVIPFDPDKGSGNGFKFGPFEAGAFLAAIRRAVDVFNQPPLWKKLITNGMKLDFSWDRSAEKYVELYQRILRR